MFQRVAYGEVAAEAMKNYMRSQEFSSDPDVRRFAHFDFHLSPEEFHKIVTRVIPDEDVALLKRYGHRILDFGKFDFDAVVSALETYKSNYRNVNVPKEFVIDEEVLSANIGFDPSLEGMQLGEAVLSLRIGDVDGLEDVERRKILDELGFDWGDKSKYLRFRFLPMLLGLRIYRHLYGFPMPRYNYVVPDEPQWPTWMVGMPLGEWAAVARVQQQILAEHYPERKSMLVSMEVFFWMRPGPIPEKYYDPVE